MEYLPINDLPNELLELIFDHLSVNDLKDASLVCKRWSDLAFSGRQMHRVKLMPDFPPGKDLLQSNRKYRHLELKNAEVFAYVKNLLQMFSVTTLRMESYSLSRSALRLILLEVPNLQHLSIVQEPDELNEMIEPLPVMRKLERLEIDYGNSNSAFPWHTIAPSLHGLRMNCYSEDQLEQWSLFSGQLKQVYATCRKDNLFTRFCKMTFPLLEELSMKLIFKHGEYEAFVQRHEFFRRNASFRHLRFHGIHLSKTLLKEITNHSKKLMYLDIIGLPPKFGSSSEPGSLESLPQLTELKHLRLKSLNADIIRGCEARTSLQSLCIDNITFDNRGTLGFLKDVFKIAPQLRCLELGSFKMRERAVRFICNNFSKLTRLQLTFSEVVSRDCLSGINLLPHLWSLELNLYYTKTMFISSIPQNKVRYLTLDLPNEYGGDDFLQVPEIFPKLNRLNLISRGECLHESTINRLRKLLPTCAIELYGCLVTNAGIKRYCRIRRRGEIMPVWEREWVWNNSNEWDWT